MALKLENINVPAGFYNALTATANAYALSQLWLVKLWVSDIQELYGEISKEHWKYEGRKWNLHDAVHTFRPEWFVGGMYYLLARGCVFPGDSVTPIRVGVNQTALIKGAIIESRNDFPSVTITFLETNASTADLFFRPWMQMVGHKSLKNMFFRRDIELVCLQKGGLQNSLVVRKRVVLEKAFPFEIDSEEYNYTGDKPIERQIGFQYSRYHIISETEPILGTVSEVYRNLAKAKGLNKRGWFDFLDPYIEALSKINRVYSQARGKIEGIGRQTTQVLRSLGLDEEARKVEDLFQDLNESLQPVDEAIGIGTRGGTGVGIAGQTIENILKLPTETADILITNIVPQSGPPPLVAGAVIHPAGTEIEEIIGQPATEAIVLNPTEPVMELFDTDEEELTE